MKNKEKLIWAVPLFILIFIFCNSATPAVESDEASYYFVYLLEKFFRLFDPEMSLSFMNHIVRKMAHFTEYFVFASSLYVAMKVAPLKYKTLNVFFLAVPIIDETIQYFTPGRSCQIKDMLLDTSGMLCALIILSLLFKKISKARD